jgi:valyl-tRNA synthetase
MPAAPSTSTDATTDGRRHPDRAGEAAPYDHGTVEREVRELWDTHDIYRFDPSADGPIFSVDTPPPYVSASHLHVGHAMSYSQPDFVVRYRRMRGDRVFYPMGFDDNGLPTERYVEKKFGITAAEMPRADFVRLCLEETRTTAARYQDLWRRVGLSVDWSLLYSTIDRRCQQTSQGAFVKLFRSGDVRRGTDPIMWCPECRTSLAQADIDDLQRTGQMYDIRFVSAASGAPLTIATTRPELLAACVALYFHPGDERYTALLGTTVRVPIFDQEVPVLTDEAVDADFGTGLMMVCTFGDVEDVAKWRRDRLELRVVVSPDGHLTELAGEFAGLDLAQARRAIVKRLAEDGSLGDSHSVKQVVGVHERCQTPIEFQIRPQWFIGVRDKQEALLGRAAELYWIPGFMRRRLEDWINGLKWDWNISRQRRYGVPFPVWFCSDCAEPILAELADLPVDPLSDAPPVSRCPACGCDQLVPDNDVMDTWMTSSLSPQINDNWAANGFADGVGLTPMSLRVQAFEIIRTWLFYTVVQSHLLFDRLPWTSVMISGWGLNEQGRKISKRDLDLSGDGFNRYVPDEVIEKYGADALRLWATKARVGNDLRYNEKDVRAGRKLAVKLWNVGRFIEMNTAEADSQKLAGDEERTAVDRWVRSHLADTVRDATAAFDDYDYMQAYQVTAKFFWSIFCDRYIEMIKDRFNDPDEHSDADRMSAQRTLREVYQVVLGLFAPFAPFITENQYQRLFRTAEGPVSLHLTPWPRPDESWLGDRDGIDSLVTVLDAVRALRAGHNLGSRAHIATLVIDARQPSARALMASIQLPLRVAARAKAVRFGAASTPSGVEDVFVAVEP